MFKNYFKTAFSNFRRHTAVSLIHIIGLSVGMTACFMIFLYVAFETSYDKFHSKADRIYRLVCDARTSDAISRGCYTSAAMIANLKADFLGQRKCFGSKVPAARSQLIGQFLTETILICLAAFLLSLLLSTLLLPLFNQLTGKTVSHNIFQPISHVLYLLILAIFVGIVAGIYPAFVLSSYKPASVLKGSFIKSSKGMLLSKTLVIAQFFISFILIAGTIVIYSQLNYMHSQELGFNKEQTLIVDTRTDPHGAEFKQAISNIPGTQSATFSSSIPGAVNDHKINFRIRKGSGEIQEEEFETNFVDFDFLKQYQIRMIAGRAFSTDFGNDSAHALILNETAVKVLGYASPRDAVGVKFSSGRGEGKIIGLQRAKEISIRKILGASIFGIVALLTGDLLKLVIISIVIGSPIAWWAMNKWLDDFPYRTTIGWGVFTMAASIAIVVALMSISFQAIKTAFANPVKNLQTE